jgi:hypothetical protein
MFGFLKDQSRSAAGAISYVTVGTLMIIWAGLWYYFFLLPEPDPPAWQKFVCVGTILSGVAIGVIGFLFGLIGQGAKRADTTIRVAHEEPVAPIASIVPSSVDVSQPATVVAPPGRQVTDVS